MGRLGQKIGLSKLYLFEPANLQNYVVWKACLPKRLSPFTNSVFEDKVSPPFFQNRPPLLPLRASPEDVDVVLAAAPADLQLHRGQRERELPGGRKERLHTESGFHTECQTMHVKQHI